MIKITLDKATPFSHSHHPAQGPPSGHLWALDKQYKKHEDALRVLLCKALITSQIFNYAWRWAIATPARPRCPPVAGRMDWRGHREISTSGKCA